MTVTSVFTILQYAIAPYLWLVVLAVAILFATQLMARLGGYRYLRHRSLIASALAVVAGLSGLAWIPAFTHSRLGFVETGFDWVAMGAALVAIAVFALLVLHPLSYMLGSRR